MLFATARQLVVEEAGSEASSHTFHTSLLAQGSPGSSQRNIDNGGSGGGGSPRTPRSGYPTPGSSPATSLLMLRVTGQAEAAGGEPPLQPQSSSYSTFLPAPPMSPPGSTLTGFGFPEAAVDATGGQLQGQGGGSRVSGNGGGGGRVSGSGSGRVSNSGGRPSDGVSRLQTSPVPALTSPPTLTLLAVGAPITADSLVVGEPATPMCIGSPSSSSPTPWPRISPSAPTLFVRASASPGSAYDPHSKHLSSSYDAVSSASLNSNSSSGPALGLGRARTEPGLLGSLPEEPPAPPGSETDATQGPGPAQASASAWLLGQKMRPHAVVPVDAAEEARAGGSPGLHSEDSGSGNLWKLVGSCEVGAEWVEAGG